METLVAMRAMLANLEQPFGFWGAINQLLQALRSGELTGICDEFHGRNASNRPMYELPDHARSLALPMQFWGHVQWQNDGETMVQVASQPFDPWIFKADWRNGNFCVSGSRGRGQSQIVRNAICVRLRETETEAFLATRAVAPKWSNVRRDDRATASSEIAGVALRPGPKPDSDWPQAIREVTQKCIEAGYKRPLQRGGKAAIQTLLLSFMADKDKHFSPDTAAKHAEAVIAELPEN